jgi:type IV secretory pathway VirB9-like protein
MLSKTVSRSLTLGLLIYSVLQGPRASHAAEPENAGPWQVATYGSTPPPTLRCNPLAACLVALEPGEVINSRFLADTASWDLEVAPAGPDAKVPLVAVKPHRCATTTNLFIATDRRVYTLILQSPECQDPAKVTASPDNFTQLRFTYPQEFARTWEQPRPLPTNGVASTATKLSQLNFDYTWDTGRRSLDPKLVYDDGAHTFIVLRHEDLNRDFPAVFVEGSNGKLESVNFTAPPPGEATYTVDRVTSRLVLVLGPDKRQKTTITNRKAR